MKKLVLISIIIVMSISGYSQTDFSGTWTITDREYISGPQYGNALPAQMTVTQAADSLVIEITPMGNPEEKRRVAFAMNGKPTSFTNETTRRKHSLSLAWSEDKKTVTFTIVFYKPGNENEVDLTRVETWSLDNGVLSVQKKSIETRSENWEVKGLFGKE